MVEIALFKECHVAPLGKFARYGECHMAFLRVKGLIKNNFNLILLLLILDCFVYLYLFINRTGLEGKKRIKINWISFRDRLHFL